jgi:hypothetical protein
LDRPAFLACGGFASARDDAAHQPGKERSMSNTTKPQRTFKLHGMTITVTQDGKTIRFRVRKDDGGPLTHEDHLQLQILEYIATNTPEGLALYRDGRTA